jgi:peptide/nickel transport system substrate-binding protein
MKISRRTALKGTAGAFALGMGGLNFDFTKAYAQADKAKRGGALNFAISAEAPHYDPHASDTYATLHLAAPFYSTLLRYNLAKFPEIEGDLAASWQVARGHFRPLGPRGICAST